MNELQINHPALSMIAQNSSIDKTPTRAATSISLLMIFLLIG